MVGWFEAQWEKGASFSNFSQLNENYAANINSLRNWDKNNEDRRPMTMSHKAQIKQINPKNKELNSYRSYWNFSQQNNTYSGVKAQKESLDEEYNNFEEYMSVTQEEVPKSILQLRKQMISKEYEALEEKKRQMHIANFSPETVSSNRRSDLESSQNIADEYNGWS